MKERLDRLNGWLGRLLFRAGGLLCAIVALVLAWSAWSQFTHREGDYPLLAAILFSLAAIGVASVIPFCFSRKRTLVEALDAMEDEVPAMRPRREP